MLVRCATLLAPVLWKWYYKKELTSNELDILKLVTVTESRYAVSKSIYFIFTSKTSSLRGHKN